MTATSEELKKDEAASVEAVSSQTEEGSGAGDDKPARPEASKRYKLSELTPFSDIISEISGETINNCYQCKKCSNGCPITYAMDIQPHQVIKMIQLGMEKEVLTSKTIWLCAACETCGTRCPNEIKLADMMDALRQRAEKSGYSVGSKRASVFHRAFLSSVEKYGRVYELGMMREFTLKAGGVIGKVFDGTLIKDAKLGLTMKKKGKLPLTADKIKGTGEVKEIFKNSQKKG